MLWTARTFSTLRIWSSSLTVVLRINGRLYVLACDSVYRGDSSAWKKSPRVSQSGSSRCMAHQG